MGKLTPGPNAKSTGLADHTLSLNDFRLLKIISSERPRACAQDKSEPGYIGRSLLIRTRSPISKHTKQNIN